ncbi:MAG: O-antigen ligase family protein [Putridiphycobacter sp.]|nr:O-antigen ligase family protein [Putridiphycobacter sp.]
MLDKWFNASVHFYVQLVALSAIVIGVSTSNVLMSLGTMLLLLNWLLEADFAAKRERFLQKPTSWIFVFLFGFGLISLIWSSNLAYGVHDLRIKLPLFIIPLVLSTSVPLARHYFYFLLYLFILTVVTTSLWNYYQFSKNFENVHDIRQMSRFISHIRYSVLVNLAIFFSYYLLLKKKWMMYLWAPIIVWLAFYQYKAQVVNGYGLFIILSILSIIYWIRNLKSIQWKRIALVGLATFVVTVFIGVIYVWQKTNVAIQNVDYSKLELYTANHNGYYHQRNTNISEDGKLVYLYVSEKECRAAWAKRSDVHFDSLDKKGHPIAGTLYRYMTSKDLRKDSIGFLSLTDKDIINIENGFSNYKTNKGLTEKISDLKMQLFLLKSHGDPNGNSIIQRKLHLLAAGGILKKKWLFGVGVGDVQDAFRQQYSASHSLLKLENQHRSHNQFLTVWISHGLIGFIALLLLWIIPFYKYLKTCDYLLCVVLISFGFSFLWQDMLETQAGVTIFALFYSLMVYKERKYVENR